MRVWWCNRERWIDKWMRVWVVCNICMLGWMNVLVASVIERCIDGWVDGGVCGWYAYMHDRLDVWVVSVVGR